MNEVNIATFIEMIQDNGCLYRTQIVVGSEKINWFISRENTRRVSINCTDETMTLQSANDLLILLELEDLIGRIPTC
jgi:hypothetical protein